MSHYAANTKVSPEASQADINLALDGGGIRGLVTLGRQYSNFAHQLMLAYVMTGDQKFLQPQHLVYDDDIRSWYSVKDIVEVMNQQHLGDVDENGSPLLYGIDCELPKHTFGPLHSATYDEFVETNLPVEDRAGRVLASGRGQGESAAFTVLAL
jgi:hypothetical protein